MILNGLWNTVQINRKYLRIYCCCYFENTPCFLMKEAVVICMLFTVIYDVRVGNHCKYRDYSPQMVHLPSL